MTIFRKNRENCLYRQW